MIRLLLVDDHAILLQALRAILEREPDLEVLKLIALGRNSPEIAEALHIASGTVQVHRQNIMHKLDLHSIAELTQYALREALIPA